MLASFMPAMFSKTALLLALLCSYVSVAATPGPLNASDIPSKSFRSGVIAQRAVKQFEGNDRTGKDGPMSRVGFDLAYIYEEHRDYKARGGKAVLNHDFKSRNSLARIQDELITIDAIAASNANELSKELADLGMLNIAVSGRIVSGRIPVNTLARLARSNKLQFVRPAYAITQSGLVTSQGDIAQASDIARSFQGLDGSGITVGVLSDSYDCRGGSIIDLASDDLPVGVNVLQEYSVCSNGTDEGRAMMQIVHDVAPGANQAFHTAFNGVADFANGIVELAIVAGADVITDDVIYLAEPMFQDGEIAQAVDSVNALGVAYYSAAGNQARQSYEADFIDSGISGYRPWYSRHDFDLTAGVDTLQAVTIPAYMEVTFVLQWQDPAFSVSGAPGATTDLDLYLYNEAGTTLFAGGTANNIGGDPVEVFSYRNNSGSEQTYQISIEHVGGPIPGKIKYVYYGSMTVEEYNTNSSTLYGHANAAGAVATGAARYDRTPAFGTLPPVIETFSSQGGTPILYDVDGDPVNIMRQKPEIVAPDGVNTTIFSSDSSIDADSYPNFFGTSAAAPHAAGVAALFKQLDSSTQPSAITSAMTSTAIDMNGTGFDYSSGYGLLQADSALATIDADADRVFNDIDNCPNDANPLQDNNDGDEEGDVCDMDDDNDGLNDADETNLGSDPLDPDTDADGVIDGSDNCLLSSNTTQTDTDNDDYGNQCDPDFDNDLIIGSVDLAFFKTRFFSHDPDADLSGDRVVNAADLAILKTLFFSQPGPSGLIP